MNKRATLVPTFCSRERRQNALILLRKGTKKFTLKIGIDTTWVFAV